MNIIQAIAKANYAATGVQIETLANAVVLGKQGESTYLRVLTAHCQAEAGTGRRRMPADAAEAIIDKVHARLYPHVQKGVAADGELPAAEVNRRSTFARTSASELRGFIARGGDLRTLDVATLTRQQLRKYGKTVPTGTRAERSFSRSAEALENAIRRIARNSPENAAERLEEEIAKLQAILDEIADQGSTTTTVPQALRTRVGTPQLHRSV